MHIAMPRAGCGMTRPLSPGDMCVVSATHTHSRIPALATHMTLSSTSSDVSLTVSSKALWRVRVSVRSVISALR